MRPFQFAPAIAVAPAVLALVKANDEDVKYDHEEQIRVRPLRGDRKETGLPTTRGLQRP